jgi:hypothetical protein
MAPSQANRWNDDFGRLPACESPRIRWSLRAMLVTLCSVAVLAAGFGYGMRQHYLRKEFTSLGCKQLYSSPRPIGRGRQYGVSFGGPGITDVSIGKAMHLSEALGIKNDTVVLNRVAITRTGLFELKRWNNTHSLFVLDSAIPREDVLTFVADCPWLTYVCVDGIVYRHETSHE